VEKILVFEPWFFKERVSKTLNNDILLNVIVSAATALEDFVAGLAESSERLTSEDGACKMST
jgi:hypothetical protein